MTTSLESDAPSPRGAAPRTESRPRAEDGLIERARTLAPFLRTRAAEAETTGRLPREVLDAMREAGLFRLLLPRSLGGLEVDPVTYILVAEEVSRADSAAGWVLQAGNMGAWWSSRLSADGARAVHGDDPSALVAAAFHPPQHAVEVEGGYRVTGRGPLASNIHDATWLFLTALVFENGQPRLTPAGPQVIGVILRASEATIIDTWDSLGMRGTDSNDVVVENVFVPAARTYPLAPALEMNALFTGPLYRFPPIGATSIIGVPVALGVAREALNELRALAAKKTAFGFMKPMRERSTVQAQVARAEGMFRAARLLFLDTIGAAWQRTVAGEASTLEQKADLLMAAAHAVRTCATVTAMMHALAGTTGIYTRSPLERHFRDMQTLRHHGFVSESRFEAAGQVYLGLPPEFPMLAL
ncbi:MAG TPA: acyl-CoA dehydrogenase family protein [Gemmatimonadaceae bacterium]|nr:acyl-CoA dehydrogenase family protein [Gemmatimonadaceae bacterium]